MIESPKRALARALRSSWEISLLSLEIAVIEAYWILILKHCRLWNNQPVSPNANPILSLYHRPSMCLRVCEWPWWEGMWHWFFEYIEEKEKSQFGAQTNVLYTLGYFYMCHILCRKRSVRKICWPTNLKWPICPKAWVFSPPWLSCLQCFLDFNT